MSTPIRDLLPRHITTGIELIGGGGGHEPWLTEHIELAELHAPPAIGRAIILASNTGQRGSDLVRMRFTDIEHYEGRPGINVVTQKTGRVLWIPMTQELIRAMERWERRPGHIITGPGGGPISRDRLSKLWQRERDENPDLAPLKALGLTFHGLRSTAVIRLRRAGVSKPLIADMVGLSGPMVDRYCRLSEQRANALAALDQMQGTTQEQAAIIPFKKPGESGS
jgi:integrase